MTVPNSSATAQWYREGHSEYELRTMKSADRIIDLLEFGRPPGDMFRPALPDIILYQNMLGSGRVSGNLGGGRFDVSSERGAFFLAAPDFALKSTVETSHQIRALVFPVAHWQTMLEVASDGPFSFDFRQLYGGTFDSPAIRAALRSIWALCNEEGPPSRLLARAAGCEILAELCRMGGAPLPVARGGLAPWAKRRCLELMHTRLAEDLSLDELAAEARLSPFHFARMFKQSTRSAAARLPHATAAGAGLRTPRKDGPSDHAGRAGGRVLVEPGPRAGLPQTHAVEPVRLSPRRPRAAGLHRAIVTTQGHAWRRKPCSARRGRCVQVAVPCRWYGAGSPTCQEWKAM